LCTLLHERLILIGTTSQVPISYRGTLLSSLSDTEEIHLSRFHVAASFPQATTGQVPPCYREALLSILLHAKHIPTSHNSPIAYELHRNATEHSSTQTSNSHKPQQALYRSHTEEPYRELFISKSYSLNHNMPLCLSGTVELKLSVTEIANVQYSVCTSNSQCENRPSSYQI
jgi:hypothetical protein